MTRFDQCSVTCTTDCGHCKGDPVGALRSTLFGMALVRRQVEIDLYAEQKHRAAIESDRDKARAELEAARPVVDAAAAYATAWDRYANPSKYPGLNEEVRRLDKANAHQALLNAVRAAAVDLYRSATSDHLSTTEEKP